MHVHPDGVLIVTRRDFGQIKPNRVERFIDPAMVSGVLQASVDCADNASFASDISGRARITGWIFLGDDDGIADFKFGMGCFHIAPQSGRTLGTSETS